MLPICACRVCPWDVRKISISLLVFLLLLPAGYGQSLGDVAREQRQKQQNKDGHVTAKKVITDEDMPAHAAGDSEPAGSSQQDKNAGSSERSKSGKLTAEQWKGRILAQKNLVANMQKQADKLAASIHFVDANAYTNGVQYNQVQILKQEKLHQLQQQLDEQKTKLEEMQEGARQAGFGNAVYDPE